MNDPIQYEKTVEALRECEELFSKTVWMNLDCAAFVRAADGTIIKANGALCRVWKTSPEAVIGKTFADFSSWKDEAEREGFDRILETEGECLDYEADLRMKDGREKTFKLTARKVTYKGEACILNTRRDVTESRLIERALKSSELRYRRLFETAKDGILILDAATGMVEDVNPFLINLLGFSHNEFLGKAVWELGFLKDLVANEGKFAELRTKKYVRYEDLPLKTAEGKKIDVEFVSNVYLVDGAQVIQCNIRDVTARRQAEVALSQLNATLEQRVLERTSQLEATNRELEAFSYSVSHDLRAPLRGITGYAQAALEDYGDQLAGDGERYLKTIQAGSHHMGTLIDDLLRFSRLGREALNKSTFPTAAMVRSAFDALGSLRKDRAVELRIAEIASSYGDPTLLKQVWINLLSNALKYTRNRETAIIDVGSTEEGGNSVYFIRDNGTGFDMRYVDKLFGVFQRLHRAEDYEGTGVGLAICQRIIHRHGGRIWAEAAVEKGATFYFTLQGGTQP